MTDEETSTDFKIQYLQVTNQNCKLFERQFLLHNLDIYLPEGFEPRMTDFLVQKRKMGQRNLLIPCFYLIRQDKNDGLDYLASSQSWAL